MGSHEVTTQTNITGFNKIFSSQFQQDLLGQVSRLRKREGQKYVNVYGKS
jgi:hypothetical protein